MSSCGFSLNRVLVSVWLADRNHFTVSGKPYLFSLSELAVTAHARPADPRGIGAKSAALRIELWLQSYSPRNIKAELPRNATDR